MVNPKRVVNRILGDRYGKNKREDSDIYFVSGQKEYESAMIQGIARGGGKILKKTYGHEHTSGTDIVDFKIKGGNQYLVDRQVRKIIGRGANEVYGGSYRI